MMIMVGSILLEKIGFTTATSDNDYKTYYETSVVETKEYTKYEWFCVMMLTFVVGALIRYAARVMIDEAMIALIKKSIQMIAKCCRYKKREDRDKNEDKEMMLYGSKNTAMIHFYDECPNGKRVKSDNRKQYSQCEWCEARRNASYDQYAEKVMNEQV